MRDWRWQRRVVVVAMGIAVMFADSAVASAANWSPLPFYGGDVPTIAVNPSNANDVLAGTYKGGIFASNDGGAHWALSNSGFSGAGSNQIFNVVFDPTTPTTVYAATNDGVWKSTNGGARWSPDNTGITTNGIKVLAIDPNTPTTLYAGTTDAGVFKTTNGGAGWAPINSGLGPANTFITSLVIDPTSTSTIYAGTGSGVGKSTTGGTSWTMMNTGLPGTSISALAIDPSNTSILYAGIPFTGLAKTTNGATSWTNTTNNLPFKDVAALLVVDGAVYVGSFGGLSKSTNGGTTWSESDSGAQFENFLGLAPIGPKLAAGTGSGFWLSSDGGSTWNPSITGMNNVVINGVAVDPTPPPFGVNVPDGIFIQAGESADISKSTSGGPFILAESGLPFGINPGTLQLNPAAPQNLFVGTGGGLYETKNGASSWSLQSLGSGTQPDITTVSNDSNGFGILVGTDTGTATFLNPSGVTSSDTQPGTITATVGSTPDAAAWVARNDGGAPTVRQYSVDPEPHWVTLTTSGLDESGAITSLVVEDGLLYASQNNKIFLYNESTSEWENIELPTEDEVSSLTDPPGTLYAGTVGGGVFTNSDPSGGGSWTAMNAGLGTLYINALTTIPNSSYLLAGTDGGGLWAIGSLPARTAITDPTTLSGSVHVSFSTQVKDVTTSGLALRVTGTTTDLAGTLTCHNAAAVASCTTGPLTSATLQPNVPLIPGQHYATVVNPTGATPITDLAGDPAVASSTPFRASTSEEESSAGARYAWQTVTDSHAVGGSYTVEHLRGASASFSFTGTSVSWDTVDGPAEGKSAVYIDGASKGTFNDYAATQTYNVAHAFTGLSSGQHKLAIVVLGEKGSAAGTDTRVAIDAFTVGSTTYATPTVKYGWQIAAAAGASGGHYAEADLRGAIVTFTFRGTGINWYTVLGPNQGEANVWIDGKAQGKFNNYAATTTYGTAHTFSGLTDAVHRLTIQVLGQKQAASTGTFVAIDRWAVT